mmetsp:Transcript_122082/g.352858  ORF Transcript_122082/g.352858 Transcript_122082/m.352858 type:complete len:220 (-) Transcript_122082:877-1536(-)
MRGAFQKIHKEVIEPLDDVRADVRLLKVGNEEEADRAPEALCQSAEELVCAPKFGGRGNRTDEEQRLAALAQGLPTPHPRHEAHAHLGLGQVVMPKGVQVRPADAHRRARHRSPKGDVEVAVGLRGPLAAGAEPVADGSLEAPMEEVEESLMAHVQPVERQLLATTTQLLQRHLRRRRAAEGYHSKAVAGCLLHAVREPRLELGRRQRWRTRWRRPGRN